MPDRWSSSLSAPRRALGPFVGAWAVLTLIPFLPALVSPLPQSPYFPLSVEVLVLGTLVVYAGRTRLERLARIGAGLGIGALLLYEGYDALVYSAFHRSGIVAEDLRFADDLGYLMLGLLTWRAGAVALLALGAIVGFGWGVDRAVRTLARTGRYGGCRAALLAAHVVAWPLVGAVGPALELGPVNMTYQSSSERARVHTTTASVLANARASLRLRTMLDSLNRAPVDSTYAAYDSLRLNRRPSIYLFMVESYGAVLNRHPALRGPYRSLLRHTESVLHADGWHAATARCEVPVQGGRSWLSIASLLTGVRVEHQLLYNQFQASADSADAQIPHLVRTLDRQGYRTIALQPFTYERPGLPVQNTYDFDATIYRDDLHYRGPSYGLANAPDQYSLHFTHETELAPSEPPFFLLFETVDSHSLWNYGLPPYLDDWRRFNEQSEATRSPHSDPGTAPPIFLPDSVTTPSIYDQPTRLRYLRHIGHELRVLRAYLTEKAPPGSLVLLLGDHQPPLLDTKDGTVPLHLLSTDSTLVDIARRHGFTEGLPPTDEGLRIREEALYSFLVRLLAAHERGGSAADSTALPALKSRGVSPSLLVQ